MNENFDELDARLHKSDPAVDAPALDADLLSRATNAKPAKPKRFAFKLTGAFAGIAAAVAVAVAVATPAQPLFELVGANSASVGAEDMKVGGASAMMPFIQYEFAAGPDLSNSESSGSVFQVTPSDNMADQMADLASYFGIEGNAHSQPDYPTEFTYGGNAKGEYVSGSAMLYFSTATGSFSYSNDAAWGITTCDANKVCTEEKAAPSNTVPMPTKAQATAKAQEVFDAACGFGGEVRYEYFSDPSYAYLNAYLQIDGIDTLQYTVSWSATGELAGAYGYCVNVKSKGVFSTVSPSMAVTRLNDYRWSASLPASFYQEKQFWGGLRLGMADDMVVGSSESGSGETEPAPAVVEPTAEPAVTGEPAPVDPMPIETATPVEPEPVPSPSLEKIYIVKAKLTLVMVWDSKGSVWMVPGWALYADQGLVGGVIALHDGVIKLPEVMPMVK